MTGPERGEGEGTEESTTTEELEELRRTLQDAGLAMLEAATTAVTAAARETEGASAFVVASAQRTLTAAEEQLRRLRAHLEAQGVPLDRPEPRPQETEQERYGVLSPG